MRRNHQQALAQLKEAKLGSKKRTEQYEVREEKDIIMDVTEEDYQALKQKMGKTKFIAGDDFGIGYDDDGEIDFIEEEEPIEEEEEEKSKRPKIDSKNITNFMKPGISMKPKALRRPEAPEAAKLMENLLLLMDDDTVMADQVLSMGNVANKQITFAADRGISRTQAMDIALKNRYNKPVAPINKVPIVNESKQFESVKKAIYDTVVPAQPIEETESRKRKRAGDTKVILNKILSPKIEEEEEAVFQPEQLDMKIEEPIIYEEAPMEIEEVKPETKQEETEELCEEFKALETELPLDSLSAKYLPIKDDQLAVY